MAFIKELSTREPNGLTRQEVIADIQRTQETIVSTVDQVLASKAETDMKREAAEAKLTALTILQQFGIQNAAQRLEAFCRELIEGSNLELAKLGRRAAFANAAQAFVQGDGSNAEPILEDFKRLVAKEEKDTPLLSFASEISNLFEQSGHADQSLEILRLIKQEYQDVKDPRILAALSNLQERAILIRTGVLSQFRAMVGGESNGPDRFLEAAKKLLAEADITPQIVRMLLEQAAPTLESLDPEAGAKLYDQLARFEDHGNEEIAAMVQHALENFRRRRDLVNQPFQLTGVTPDGKPFDWSRYRGKVVLVDFWATWCVPCLQEMPNIKLNYEAYRSAGFEVVGVNLDDDPLDVQRFFSVQQLPWPTVVSEDPQRRGMDSPLAVKHGVNYIPFSLLVGRDGRVAAVNVRGERLGPRVAELLSTGPAEPPRGD